MDATDVQDSWVSVEPQLEAVTLHVRSGAGNQSTFTDYALPRASRKKLNKEQRLALGFLAAKSYVPFAIWKESRDSVSCPLPKASDKLTDQDGAVWLIESVEEKLFGVVCEVLCRKATG